MIIYGEDHDLYRDEFIEDLMKLAEIPFELEEHQKIFIQDINCENKEKQRKEQKFSEKKKKKHVS